jgi:glycosyltransferase involved in cell wall biosynthesis
MKILHIRNIANVAYNLSLQQKSLGHQVRILDITENYTNDYEDISLNLPLNYPKKDLLKRFYTIYKTLIKLLREENFDIIHLHDGGISPMDLDIPLLFKFYGKVVIHWHGSKLRNNGKSFGSRFADVKIVSTPDLLEYAPEATWVPNPIGWHGLTRIDRNDDKILIGHAPTNRYNKGTEYFISAMSILKEKHANIEYIIIENTPHYKTLELLSKCDIVVDAVGFTGKIKIGWYGILTNEVQQMGIPACTWIKPSVESYLEKPNGIINVTKDNLKQELENLIMNADLRKQLGEQGIKYVEKVHNNKKICAKIMELYNRLL